MRHRHKRKCCMCYPEDPNKAHWDLCISLILVFTCVMTPVDMAFDDVGSHWDWILRVIDCLFFIDCIIIFNSAFYDEDFRIIENYKSIASSYIQSWFFVDILAIIPFDIIMMSTVSSDDSGDNSASLNKIVRVVRIGRMYKLIKLTKLLRMLKVVKEKSKLFKFVQEYIKIGTGFERLFFGLLIFIVIIHIVSCLWIFFGQFDFIGSWLDSTDIEVMDSSTLYLTSFYFTTTTVTTVGYGDFSANTIPEKIFCIIMMLIGVISFSLSSASLSSLLSNYDTSNAKFQEKVVVLNRIYKEFFLPLELYQRLKQSLKYNYN